MNVEIPSAVPSEPAWKTLHPNAVVVPQRFGLATLTSYTAGTEDTLFEQVREGAAP